MVEYIEKLFSANEGNIGWHYVGPSDKTEPIVNADNLLHLAARTANIEKFLSIFKQSVKENINLLEYNEDHENPFHIAARMGILPNIVRGIFHHLDDEQTNTNSDLKRLENLKNYIRNALGSRCALSNSKRTPLDWISKEVKNEVKGIVGIKDSPICSKKLHLCLYIIGAVACITTLCISLYFLYLSSQSVALASMAGIASSEAAYLSGKVFSEIHNLHDVSTPVETLSNTDLARCYLTCNKITEL